MKKISIRFTLEELEVLNLCIGNGWGDGDFDEWLNNEKESKDLADGWSRIRTILNFERDRWLNQDRKGETK